MTDLEKHEPTASPVTSGMSRRGVIKAAAWSLPVIAVAVSAPAASASVGNADVAWTGSQTGLLTLNLLGGGVLTAGALVTVPNEFTISNGPGPISTTATITVVVGRPAGINIPVGRARGFGVYSLNGANVAGQNTVTYQSAPVVGQYGFPSTTFTGALPVTIGANGALEVPVVFGLSGNSTGVSISALSSFPVTLTVDLGGGNTYTATSAITVPVGAGIL